MPRKSSSSFAVVAGTGIEGLFEVASRKRVQTEFGDSIVSLTRDGFYLLARHGEGHKIPPHKVDYRANIAALRKLGVAFVVATSAVGSMKESYKVGSIGLLGQFLDFTKGREGTFFDSVVHHTDMTDPYSALLNRALAAEARELGLDVNTGLTYACVEGPRFETAAEVRMLRALGGDVVGMTGVPEVVLANEVGMEYASIVVVTNWAAGIEGKVSHERVGAVMKREGRNVRDLTTLTIKRLSSGGQKR